MGHVCDCTNMHCCHASCATSEHVPLLPHSLLALACVALWSISILEWIIGLNANGESDAYMHQTKSLSHS
jgi:hypothetical protein